MYLIDVVRNGNGCELKEGGKLELNESVTSALVSQDLSLIALALKGGKVMLCEISQSGKLALSTVAEIDAPASVYSMAFSPNGRWFAYCEGDSGADQVYVQPYPTNGKRWRLSRESGSSPQWSGDGRAVYFTRSDNHVIRVEVREAGGELIPRAAEDLFLAPGTFEHRAVLRDPVRNRFLVPVLRDQTTDALDVVLNWPALLR